jgi:RimJ/RimL family protein N-acetyltransferase
LKYLISKYESPVELNTQPYVLGVELISTKELIGHIGLSPVKEGVEIGYGIAENYQGLGYATEAVSNFCPWAINEFDLDCIWGIVDQDNKGSIKVLTNANFKFVKKDNYRLKYIFK